MRVQSIQWALIAAPMFFMATSANAQWSDNMDGYVNGTFLEGQGNWTHWDNGTPAGSIVTNAFSTSAPHSVSVGPGSDTVQEFTGATSGQWVMTTQVFVPTSFVGKTYFIMMNRYGGALAYQWAVQVGLNGDTGLVECDCGQAVPTTAPLLTGQWVEIRVDIDLDGDVTVVSYNGTVIDTYPWSAGPFGTASYNNIRIKAINLYADTVTTPHVTEIYYDDFDLSGATTGGIGTNYCLGTANSTGSGAVISATGSTVVASNNFSLRAQPVPNQPGLFFYAANQTQVPFGNGFRCVDGFITRLDVENATNNVITHNVDLPNPPTAMGLITSGSTWNFQAWYRDPAAGGLFFNLSDGLEVTFQ